MELLHPFLVSYDEWKKAARRAQNKDLQGYDFGQLFIHPRDPQTKTFAVSLQCAAKKKQALYHI